MVVDGKGAATASSAGRRVGLRRAHKRKIPPAESNDTSFWCQYIEPYRIEYKLSATAKDVASSIQRGQARVA